MSEVFPVSYSLLNPDALASQVLNDYDLQAPVRGTVQLPSYIRFYNHGVNDIYVVHDATDRYVLRISPGGFPEEYVDGEVTLLNELAAAGFSVPAPIQRRDGKYVWTLLAPEGLRCAVLFRYIEGVLGYPTINSCQGYAFGQFCAKLHNWSDVKGTAFCRPTLDLDELVSQPLAALECHPLAGELDIQQFREIAEATRYHIGQIPTAAPEFGLCHGDLHNGNAIFADQKTTIIDFDTSGYSWRAYDLATFRSVTLDHEDRQQGAQLWQAFLDGYGANRPLSEKVLASIPFFLAARMIWLVGRQIAIGHRWGEFWIRDRLRDRFAEVARFHREINRIFG